MIRSTISNESPTSHFSLFQECKPFDEEELYIIENRPVAGKINRLLRSETEGAYGALEPTDDDIDEELNLMGTYL